VQTNYLSYFTSCMCHCVTGRLVEVTAARRRFFVAYITCLVHEMVLCVLQQVDPGGVAACRSYRLV